MKLGHSPQWEELSLNHLEGRTAAFFCYGDGGGDELDDEGRTRILQHKEYFDPAREPFENIATPTRLLSGNVATAASRCPINSGVISNSGTGKNTATIRPRT